MFSSPTRSMTGPNDTGAVGVLGGTFDPVHYAHLRLAEDARQGLHLAAVVLIPAGRPPHRAPPATPPQHRLEMVRLAIAGNAAFALDDAEVNADGPSYTILTLERLRRRLGSRVPLVLLLGADAFLGLPAWRRWQELFDYAHIGVAGRPGFARGDVPLKPPLAQEYLRRRLTKPDLSGAGAAGAIVEFEMTSLDISASAIRAQLAAARSVRYLLPDSVLDYIDRHQLYRDGR